MHDFEFYDPGELVDGELRLALVYTRLPDGGRIEVPTYEFMMIRDGVEQATGFTNLRVGNTPNIVLYRGHIGSSVEPEHRGHHFAARSCRLLLPLARRHGLTPLWITCDPDNRASRRSCELAGATLVEIVD